MIFEFSKAQDVLMITSSKNKCSVTWFGNLLEKPRSFHFCKVTLS